MAAGKDVPSSQRLRDCGRLDWEGRRGAEFRENCDQLSGDAELTEGLCPVACLGDWSADIFLLNDVFTLVGSAGR